jgi:hypothetical protein
MRVTIKQIAAILKFTKRTVQRRAISEEWSYISLTGLGGERRVYDFDGLSTVIKKRFISDLISMLDFSTQNSHMGADDICVIRDKPQRAVNESLSEHPIGTDALALTNSMINDEEVMKAGVLSAAVLYAQLAGQGKIKGFDGFADNYSAANLPIQQCVYDNMKHVSRTSLLRWEKSLSQPIKATFVNLVNDCEVDSFQTMLMTELGKLKVSLIPDEQTRLMALLIRSNIIESI